MKNQPSKLSSPSNTKTQRRVLALLVEPFKQIKLGIYVLVSTVVFVGIAAIMFMTAFREQYEHVMTLFNVVDPGAQWSLLVNEVFLRNAIKIGVLFVGYLLFLLWMVFKITHRYYGPLISIERFIEELRRGNYGARVSVRRKDELQNLVVHLNQLAETLQHSGKSSCGCGQGCECCKR